MAQPGAARCQAGSLGGMEKCFPDCERKPGMIYNYEVAQQKQRRSGRDLCDVAAGSRATKLHILTSE